jgi:hypothetical protein
MSNSRLLSGRVLKKTGADLEQSRYEFLDLASAEPDLGQPNFDGAVLISDADGSRYWTDNIRIDLTGNIYVGTISNADGSSAIRLVDNVLMEDNLVVNGLTTAPDLFTSRISSPDSSAITFIPAVILNSDLTVDGDAVITGNLTVQGTTTTINSTQLSVEDKNIELANGAGTAAEADGAGITVNGPAVAASLIYTASDDTWNFNKTLKSNVVGDVTGNITGSVFTTEIDSPDSSAISVIPAVIFNSDVIVENEIQGNLVGQVSDISNHSIGDLSDVDLDSLPLDNQTLVWDSAQGKFVPGDSFSQTDFDTAFGTKSVGDLSDVDLTSNAPTEGQTLVWDSAEGKFVPGRALGSSDSVDFDTVIANIVTNSIDSADSSEIVITPSVRVLSDLTVENDLTVSNEVSAEKFVGYLDGSARDIESTALTNKQLATELDNNADQIFVYDESAGELKKTYLSEITAFGETGYTGSQGDIGYTGSQGPAGTGIRLLGSVNTSQDLPSDGTLLVPGDAYITADTGRLWVWNGSAWSDVGQFTGDIGPVGYTGSRGLDGQGIIEANIQGDDLVVTYADSTQDNLGRVTGYTGSQGLGLDEWIKITANYTASSGNRIIADTTAGSFTITLPSSPSVGSYIVLTDGGNWRDNPLTISAEGASIEGYNDDVLVDIGGVTTELLWDGSIWQITATIGAAGNPGPGVPEGGTTGQILAKASAADYDTAWVDSAGGGGGGGADSYVKTYFWEGALQENVSRKRFYIHVNSTLETITVNLGTSALTETTIAVKLNGTVLNSINIPANTTYVTTSVNHSMVVNDFITVDITKSSSAENLYVTLVYREG